MANFGTSLTKLRSSDDDDDDDGDDNLAHARPSLIKNLYPPIPYIIISVDDYSRLKN